MAGETPHAAVVSVPFGKLGIRVEHSRFLGIDFLDSHIRTRRSSDGTTAQVITELEHYFNDPSWRFTLPLFLEGTHFQMRVWRVLRDIPPGTVRSYLDVARQLASSPRAVGNACRANPVPIVIPCHRVVAVNDIGGFAGTRTGHALTIKRWLLQHEKHAEAHVVAYGQYGAG